VEREIVSAEADLVFLGAAVVVVLAGGCGFLRNGCGDDHFLAVARKVERLVNVLV
jgi:hypothetical protein